MSTKKSAFSLMETLIAITVIGVFAAISITVLFKDKSRQEVTEKTITMSLFSDFDKVYDGILNYKCNKKFSLSNLEDINKDKEINSKDIAEYLVSSYTGSIESSCNELKKPSNFQLLGDTTCVDLAPNAFAAISLDKKCKTQIIYNEAKGQTNKTTSNACGFIAYSLKNSKGVLGEDFFVYPFLKTSHTKRTIKK